MVFGMTSKFTNQPSEQFCRVVASLRQLGPDETRVAYAEAMHDDGEDFARELKLTKGKLSDYNVGRLLPGIPASLLAAAGDKIRASLQREQMIRSIASRQGWMDHGQLFLKAGKPHVIVGQPYHLTAEDLESICLITTTWGLRLRISGRSWYYPGMSLTVRLYRGEPTTLARTSIPPLEPTDLASAAR